MSLNGTSLSGRGSRGRPSTRSAIALRCTSSVPPPMCSDAMPRKRCCGDLDAGRRPAPDSVPAAPSNSIARRRRGRAQLRHEDLDDRTFGFWDLSGQELRLHSRVQNVQDLLARDRRRRAADGPKDRRSCRSACASSTTCSNGIEKLPMPPPIDERSCSRVVIATRPAFARLAHAIRVGDHHIVEEHLGEVRAAVDLTQRTHLDAGRVHVQKKDRRAPSAWVGPSRGARRASPRSDSRAPELQTFCPLTTQPSSVTFGLRRDRAEIRAGAGLAEELAPRPRRLARSSSRYLSFCSGVPRAMIVGPASPIPTKSKMN